MEKQKLRIHEVIDGRCPVDIDKVAEIGLSPLEKRAIFITLSKEIEKTKELVKKSEQEKIPA